MSHISKAKCDIQNAQQSVLEGAIDLMLKNVPGIQRVEKIRDWFDKEIKVKGIGIKLQHSRHGQDIYIKDGELIIEGEDMDNTKTLLNKELHRYYKAHAGVMAFRKLGCQTQVQLVKNKIQVIAVSR